LIYWVHIELVYGNWLGPWKENLTIPQTAALAVGVGALMLGLSVAKTQWKSWRRVVPATLGYYFSTTRRVSGD